MTDIRRRNLLSLAGGMPLLAALPRARAAEFPRGVKIIVPFVAGGGVDMLLRPFAELLGPQLKTNVIIENKPGGSGLVALQSLVNAPADGSTLLYLHAGMVTIGEIQGRPSVVEQIEPAAGFAGLPHLLMVRADSPYKTQADLVAAIKAAPGKLNYGSGGSGSPTHLMVALMAELVPDGMPAMHIPYKGAAEAILALLSGQLHFTFAQPISVAEHIENGKLRALSVTSASRNPLYPAVPTVAEAGLKDYVMHSWGGFVVPKKTPADTVEQLSSAVRTAGAATSFVNYANRMGIQLRISSSQEFSKLLGEQAIFQKRLVERLGLRKKETGD